MKIKKKTIIEDVKRKTQFFRLNTFLNFGSDEKSLGDFFDALSVSAPKD